jgi:hypothetical protein
LAVIGSLLALSLIGSVAGRKSSDGATHGIGGGLAEIVQLPAMLAIFSGAALLWLVYAVRRILLCWRARAPGPILVLPLENATRQDTLPIRDLGLQLQQLLSRVRLPAAEIPGGSASVEFIQQLTQTELDVKRPLGFIGGILGLTVPTHAYEAKVTLLEREDAPSCGVALEMTILPRRLATFHRYWEDTWERSIERAAHGIAADVLPANTAMRRAVGHMALAPASRRTVRPVSAGPTQAA